MAFCVESLKQMPDEMRAYAAPTHFFSDAEMTQIILLRVWRPDDRLHAKAPHHDTPRANCTVESPYLKRARNREARHRATIERGAHGNNLPAHLGDTMSPPAELATTV